MAQGGVRRERQEKAAAAGGSGTAEDEGGGGVHCGFIPANTFIMADLAEPVTHCPGYISAFIPTLTFSLLCPLPLHRLISIPTESSPVYPVFCKTSLFQWLLNSSHNTWSERVPERLRCSKCHVSHWHVLRSCYFDRNFYCGNKYFIVAAW